MIHAAPTLSPQDARRWCVVTTKVAEEKLALAELEDRARKRGVDLEVYLPMRMGHARSRNPIQPLFPRHLFVRIDLEAGNYAFIFTTRGVQSVMMAGDRPGWIRDDRIADIRAREVGGLVTLDDAPVAQPEKVDPAAPWPAEEIEADGGPRQADTKLKPGDRVKVEGLPWEAVFSKWLDRDRGEVLFSVVGIDSKPAKAVRSISQISRAPSI